MIIPEPIKNIFAPTSAAFKAVLFLFYNEFYYKTVIHILHKFLASKVHVQQFAYSLEAKIRRIF